MPAGGAMKKLKAEKEMKTNRPPRAIVLKKEALERMKEFPTRKEQFPANARTGKSRSVHS